MCHWLWCWVTHHWHLESEDTQKLNSSSLDDQKLWLGESGTSAQQIRLVFKTVYWFWVLVKRKKMWWVNKEEKKMMREEEDEEEERGGGGKRGGGQGRGGWGRRKGEGRRGEGESTGNPAAGVFIPNASTHYWELAWVPQHRSSFVVYKVGNKTIFLF